MGDQETQETQALETQETETQETQETSTDEKPKLVPLKEHIELRNRAKAAEKRLKELEAAEAEREKAKLSEVERAQKEVEELRKTNQDLLSRQAKSEAFLKAKGSIGDGFTLDGVEDRLYQKILKMPYDPEDPEGFEADVFDMVDLAKKPKAAGRGVIRNNAGSVGEKKASDYTTAELKKLKLDDPDRYNSVLAERRSKIGFPSTPSTPQWRQASGTTRATTKRK